MNPQERQVIDGIFDRLKNVANQPRDPEAERYIGDLVQKQPYATYALAQSVYVQEQALLNQQQQIEQLEAEVAELRARPQQPASGGGFLSGLFGGGGQQRPPENVPAYGQRREAPLQAPAGPWGGQPQAAGPGPWGQPQRQGMGFLGTAAAAATGVAGGMVLGSILSSALGGGAAQAASSQANSLFGNNTSQDRAGTQEEQSYEDNTQDASWDDGGYGDDSFEA
ncbi:MAG: DUF2076 domain-containing protein [Methylobacterium sp.]|nr:DUF2076 domain-containing protein [Methylobacterium sp.]MCA3639815.1 DUF2076 domain-containing protein [Methylobacterium sp.]